MLRAPGWATGRLVSARIIPTNPVPTKWAAIRDERTASNPVEIGFAKHRYLYVPDEGLERGRATFEGSGVSVVAFSDVNAAPPAR